MFAFSQSKFTDIWRTLWHGLTRPSWRERSCRTMMRSVLYFSFSKYAECRWFVQLDDFDLLWWPWSGIILASPLYCAGPRYCGCWILSLHIRATWNKQPMVGKRALQRSGKTLANTRIPLIYLVHWKDYFCCDSLGHLSYILTSFASTLFVDSLQKICKIQ
jgi:hypothetical protein